MNLLNALDVGESGAYQLPGSNAVGNHVSKPMNDLERSLAKQREKAATRLKANDGTITADECSCLPGFTERCGIGESGAYRLPGSNAVGNDASNPMNDLERKLQSQRQKADANEGAAFNWSFK